MKMGWFDGLRDFVKRRLPRKIEVPVQEKEPDVGFVHLYATLKGPNPQEEGRVVFIDKERGIRRPIVDRNGQILDFPGIEEREAIQRHIQHGKLDPVVRYEASFEKRDDGYMMLWTVQPDGRYWEDEDGFGAESDEEICLYALMDRDGRFVSSFRPYRIGITDFYDRS